MLKYLHISIILLYYSNIYKEHLIKTFLKKCVKIFGSVDFLAYLCSIIKKKEVIMSLDVYLISKEPITKRGTGVFIRENGKNKELTIEDVRNKFPDAVIEENEFETECVFCANITHNLNEMADAAGLYEACWRPENIKAEKAKDIIPILAKGLEDMKARPTFYKQYNSSNGWGVYENLVEFVESYLNACREYPDATIDISR
jgi:hypothetical protein